MAQSNLGCVLAAGYPLIPVASALFQQHDAARETGQRKELCSLIQQTARSGKEQELANK